MEPGRLQEAGPVGGGNGQVDGAAVAVDRERHADPRMAERPDMAEKIGEVIDLVSSHGEDEVADFDAARSAGPPAASPMTRTLSSTSVA